MSILFTRPLGRFGFDFRDLSLKRAVLPVITCATLLLGGCSLGGLIPQKPAANAGGSGKNASSERREVRKSTLVFAQLPTTRPEVNVKPQSAELFEASLVALRAANYGRAETLLKKITQIQPELSGPWLNLGQVYLAGQRTDSARDAFEQAIEANPTNCAAYNQLGVLARQEGRLDEAEGSYLACIDRDPTYAQVYLNLGILYEVYLGKLELALKAYREYQDLASISGTEDARVKGWVVDLERRL